MSGHCAKSHGKTAAILLPCCFAGLLFLGCGFLVAGLFPTSPASVEILPFLVFGFAFSIPVGFALASLPMVAGVLTMSRLGELNDRMRHPVAWGAAGFAMSLALLALFGVTDMAGGPALLFTGTCCALFARSFVRWTDEASLADVF